MDYEVHRLNGVFYVNGTTQDNIQFIKDRLLTNENMEIKCFKVFHDDQGEYPNFYTMSITTVNNLEYRFSSLNCGYGGGGPSGTKKVLQMLGVNESSETIETEKYIIRERPFIEKTVQLIVNGKDNNKIDEIIIEFRCINDVFQFIDLIDSFSTIRRDNIAINKYEIFPYYELSDLTEEDIIHEIRFLTKIKRGKVNG